jgi:hypothetical protein
MDAKTMLAVGAVVKRLEAACGKHCVGLFFAGKPASVWHDGVEVGTLDHEEGGDGSRFVFVPLADEDVSVDDVPDESSEAEAEPEDE